MMSNGKRVKTSEPRFGKRPGIVVASLVLLLTVTVGGTLAYLIDATRNLENTFAPSDVSTQVEEGFDGTTKTNVNVTNTGDIDAYIRVKLVTYRVNDQGQHIGGLAEIPEFTPGEGWFEKDGFYYYTDPVAPEGKPKFALIDSIDLKGTYDDDEGGKQVIEVMAEGIQADGVDEATKKPAVTIAWGVKVVDGKLSKD